VRDRARQAVVGHGVEPEVVAAAHALFGVGAERRQQRGDRAVAGQHRVRVDVEPRPQHGGALRGAGVGQQELGVGAAHVPASATVMTSTSSVRGPHRTSRTRPAASSSAWPRRSHPQASTAGSATSSTALRKSSCDTPPHGAVS
jgi:hypothetical protein